MNMLTKYFKFTLNQSAFGLSSLMLLLLGVWVSGTARADWTKFDSVDTGTYYLDLGTVKKSGYIRSFWSILDYRLPQKTSRGMHYQSTRTHMEIDCRQKTVLGPCWVVKSLTRRASCAIGSPFRQTLRWKNFTEWFVRANLNKATFKLTRGLMASPSQPEANANNQA
jgi:hypothetical protein